MALRAGEDEMKEAREGSDSGDTAPELQI
jgi:hypothetical protein